MRAAAVIVAAAGAIVPIVASCTSSAPVAGAPVGDLEPVPVPVPALAPAPAPDPDHVIVSEPVAWVGCHRERSLRAEEREVLSRYYFDRGMARFDACDYAEAARLFGIAAEFRPENRSAQNYRSLAEIVIDAFSPCFSVGPRDSEATARD